MVLVGKSESPEDRKYVKSDNDAFFLTDFTGIPTCRLQNILYICHIILKGCLALSNQTERQAEIIPVGELKVIS